METKTNLEKWVVMVVLLVGLNGAVQAQTDINVVNPSFEWADEANLVTCRGGQGRGSGLELGPRAVLQRLGGRGRKLRLGNGVPGLL